MQSKQILWNNVGKNQWEVYGVSDFTSVMLLESLNMQLVKLTKNKMELILPKFNLYMLLEMFNNTKISVLKNSKNHLPIKKLLMNLPKVLATLNKLGFYMFLLVSQMESTILKLSSISNHSSSSKLIKPITLVVFKKPLF
jgi:hypothetical protein